MSDGDPTTSILLYMECLNNPCMCRAIKHEQDVSGWYDKSKYTTERIEATTADGVRVPISLLYRKDLVRRDGSDPLLLDA